MPQTLSQVVVLLTQEAKQDFQYMELMRKVALGGKSTSFDTSVYKRPVFGAADHLQHFTFIKLQSCFQTGLSFHLLSIFSGQIEANYFSNYLPICLALFQSDSPPPVDPAPGHAIGFMPADVGIT